MSQPPRRVFYDPKSEPRRPMRRERTPEEREAIRRAIAQAEYGLARERAMRGEAPWPTIPEAERPRSGALKSPENTLVNRRDFYASLAMLSGSSVTRGIAEGWLDDATEKLRRP